jgi:hypothetical protein
MWDGHSVCQYSGYCSNNSCIGSQSNEIVYWREYIQHVLRTFVSFVSFSSAVTICVRIRIGVLRNIASYIYDRLCGVVVRVPGYTTEMYCASCEVRAEFIYVM